ncbi:MAG: C40 family peptidase [Bacteroidales bacterium]|nr:C40 family peptidase [Bacteroidales bacterium]
MNKKAAFVLLMLLIVSFVQAQNSVPLSKTDSALHDSTGFFRTDIIKFAKKYLGTTYQYGSIDPAKGFDCSGFVYFVFNHFNIRLPDSSKGYKSLGTALKPDEFKVGDILVFYGYKDKNNIGHVGIICEADGMKSKFIHASSGEVYGVTISRLDSKMYARRFYKCIDVIRKK